MSKIEELRAIAVKANAEIKQIQDECSHPVSCVTKQYSGDTGNWDKYDDSYSISLHCELCDKSWGYSYSGHDTYNNIDKEGRFAAYQEASRKYTREVKKK